MARSRSSRKGKKEWRRNISTKEQQAFLDRHCREERSGGALDALPSPSLFFVDRGKAPVKKLRKVDVARMRTLHSDSVLQRASLVPPVRSNPPRPKKSFLKRQQKTVPGGLEKAAPGTGKEAEGENAGDLWPAEDLGGQREGDGEQPKQSKRRRVGASLDAVVVPAVEVDQPGCSYNPTFEDHQDALAVAVAEEVLKEVKMELEPTAPPLEVVRPTGAAADLEMLAGLEALLSEGEVGPTLEESTPEDEQEQDADVAPPAPARPVKVQKLTRADLNRRLRRRAQEAALAAKLRRKKLRKDAERVEEIAAELREQEEETEKRRQRREVARRERRMEAPPRLGKHRFEPEPVNVPLTEELTGSLRQVKGCSTLARDRFKSFQKRGLVEPRVPVMRKAAKRRRIVETGTKGRMEREMHAEILQMRAARKSKGDVINVE